MPLHLLKPANYLRMPWKNGQGITYEIAAERSEEDTRRGSFVWRLSIAEVGVAAPFSVFPNCDRTIVLLAGDGMILDSGGDGHHVLDQRFVPYAFRGDWQTDCTLIGGPCRDFNIMVERRRAQATITAIAMHGSAQSYPLVGQMSALFVMRGELAVACEGDGESLAVPAEHTLLLHADDASRLSSRLSVRSDGEASALLISFALTNA